MRDGDMSVGMNCDGDMCDSGLHRVAFVCQQPCGAALAAVIQACVPYE